MGINNYNIAVSNCYIQGYIALNDTASNIVISNNIFAGVTNIASVDMLNTLPRNAIFNVIIQNNIFNGTIWGLSAPSSIIQNNIFLNGSSAFRNISACGLCPHYYIENALIYNNIFYRANPIAEVSASCTYKSNITYNPTGPFTTLPGTGNLDNTDPLFINFPAAGALFDWNHNYSLQASSPGINAGSDGLNIGREGGNNSGSLHGETIGLPVIRKMQVQNFNVPQGGNIDVKVRSTKARTN